MTPDKQQAAAFIEALAGDVNAPMAFQVFDDGKPTDHGKARTLIGTLDKTWPALCRANANGCGVFVTINKVHGSRRTTENIDALRALFVDCDDGDLPPLPIPPNIIVNSGRGQHAYWLLEEDEPLERFAAAQVILAAVLGTDPKIKDLPRVMRLPGSYHKKGNPKLVTCEVADTDHVHTIESLLDAFPTPEVTHENKSQGYALAGPLTTEQKLTTIERCRAYLAKVGPAVEGEGGDHKTYRVAALGGDFGLTLVEFWPLLLEWNTTCQPPWTSGDLRRKLDNAYKYRTHPSGEKAPKKRDGPDPDDNGEKLEVREGLRPISSAEAFDLWETQGEHSTLPTGIATLDDAIGGGLPARQVVVVSAYTGIGKSEFARQIALRVSGGRRHVIHVDVELGAEQISERYFSQASGISPRLLGGKHPMSDDERQRLSSARAYVRDDTYRQLLCPGGGVPVDELFGALSMMLDGSESPALVILDSLQRLAAGASGDNQRLQVQNFTWQTQRFAREHNVAVLLVSEQSRNKEGKAPKAEDVLTAGAESRAVEFVADIVIGLLPESAPDDETIEESAPPGEVVRAWDRGVTVILAKNRRGQTGRLRERLVFSGPCWDMRSEAIAQPELSEMIIDELRSGPSTLRTLAKRLKRRRDHISAALLDLDKNGIVEHVDHHHGWRIKVVPDAGLLSSPGFGDPSRGPGLL